ncbi:Stonustoxin subunit beta, partial [Nibea albiflora]
MDDNIKVAALGRTFTLGMLYDAWRDELMPGVTLWDIRTIQENTSESSQHSSEFQMSACDSIESKASLLDVDASLKASFMSGLIEVGGSAKYLNDMKKSHNQSRVTLQYKATTNFKQLSMPDLLTMNKKQTDLIKKGLATHVVTGILYGANAFFVFDSEKLEDSSVLDIQGHMEAVVKKIPSFNIAGRIDIKLNDDEKATTEKFSCKFYGDFVLESNPVTFVDAVQTYVQLPKLLGQNGTLGVPVKIWLMPLKNLDPEAAKLSREISAGVVREAQDALEDLKEIEMRCNDFLDDVVIEDFPQIHKELSSFHKSCHYYTSKLQQTMRKKFPRIREGKEDESSVKKVFEDGHKSPFSHEKLSEWLDHKEREISIIRSCVEKMEGVKIVQSQSELHREVLAAGVEEALCFVFTSLKSADPCLDAMNHYLDSHQLRSTSEVQDYSEEVLTKMREKGKEFQNLAKAMKNNPRVCFLIASIANEKYTGATIYHYKVDGKLVSEDFTKPNLPPVEEITDRRDLMWVVGEMDSTNMTTAGLGRPFTLGMLYDARKDELIPGVTLWDGKTLQENTSENSQPSSAFQISASDSIESKASLLDVEASLEASFMSGLIEVGGSAKYLNDMKKSHNQSRVTCQYKATTNFKQLSMINLLTMSAQQKELIEKGLATHVVTGILYGANAFFVFDSEKLEASSVQDIQGHMEAVVKKIPSFNIEGKVDIKLTDEEKATTEKFSCKFYGDFVLKSNPATFVDAVKTYVQLPKLLGQNGKNGVPVKIWLMPLKNLDPEAAKLSREISIGVVREAQDALEDLKEIEMRCNDSLDDGVEEHFPQIHKDLSSFQKSCHYYTSKLQQTMRKKFPLIREGKEDESSVKKVFEDRHKSPFSHEKLSEWLDHKEREINVIRSCVEKMEGVKIVQSQEELDREVLAAGVEEALCFVFTSLESADPCLDAMNHYLDTLQLRSTNEVPWYYSDEVLTKMREKAEKVHNLAKALKNNPRVRFLIASIANEKYTGATIYHYKDGILVSEDFTKPNLPPVEEITDRRDLMWYACDLTLDPNTANGYLHLSEGNKKATCGEWQTYPDRPERFDTEPQVLCSEGLTGRHYWEVGEMDDNIKVAALGRTFTLGMLYDAWRDELMPGVTLWDIRTIQENTSESSQHSSEFQMSACDSIESKASLLDVDASLKASFMSGLIEVGGSAKYLNDMKKSHNQSRVTLQYKATTNFKQLSMPDLLTMNKKQTDLIKKGLATHVVTGILYGANAFFVFDSEKLEDSSVLDIQGHMEAVVKKIPSFNIAGRIDIKLNDDEKATTEKFSCKFYGDFVLESNPVTFVDAVQTYVQLPKLLGQNGTLGVPVKIWLMPLKNLDPEAAKLSREISAGVVREAQDALEDLKEIEMRCNDFLDDVVIEDFPQIHKELSSFHKSCHYYTSKLQQTMRKKFPRIREGKEDESSVKKVFEDGHKSPFSHEKLSEWLDHKEREISIIRSCVEKMEGVKIVQSQSELHREVLAAGVEEALCFVFTSLKSADPCLDAMNHYLDSHQLRSTSEVQDYSEEVLTKMREKGKEFQNLAKALKNNPRVCFLIASIANEKYTGATIYHYKVDGKLVSEDFTKPNLPPVEEITDRRDLMWYACDLTLDPNTANGYLHLSEGNKKAAFGSWQKYPDRPERFGTQTQVLCSERLTGRHYWEVELSANMTQALHDISQQVGEMDSTNMTTAGLGRPFTLGMLYDARKDELIPGVTLWDGKTLQENTSENSQPSSAFQISASDSIESKASLLDVEASLEASFMSGLIEVGGSAKYLNDMKKSHNQSRVTCQYKATTNFKQLSMINLLTMSAQQKELIEKGLATHVVTGILYGANAFFVFDSEKLEASSVQDIQGHMEAVVKKIPSFNIEGKVDIKLTDEEKATTEKFSCKFYGDFVLKSNPATFVDAVKTYVQLPKLLGQNGKNGVPVKIWLMPLKNLDPEAAKLSREISIGVVREAQDALEDLKEIEMRCNDSLDDGVEEHFPQIHKDLSSFQKSCHYYTSKLQQTMRKKFPLIREGKEDESSVKKVFEDRHKSPFSHEKLSEWLDHKEREINVIRSCVEKMEGVKIVQSQEELDREVLAADVEEALCFVFTSLESADPCLDAMNHYLDTLQLRSTNEVPWYYSDEVLTKMREKAEKVHNLAKALKNNPRVCFLIASIANEKYTGATIYRYKDGILVSEDFTKPNLPPVEEITDRRDLMWYACDLTLDPNTANGYLHLSEGNKKATCGEWQKYPDRPERFDEYTQVLCSEGLTGRHYWEVGEMDSANMKIAALGRPFTLGMLYDARKDELIPASLKASFLGGLIEVGGSAKYLNDTKKFKNQSRVTCQYKATTNFKQLSMINLLTMNAQQKELIEKGFATHVVTGILYGADAFFVFDSEKLEASSVQDIQGHMEAVVKKIPSFDIGGGVDIKLTDEEKATTEKFSCKFYGDFVLESNPATFVDAVKTYVQLPKLLGQNGENSVPVKICLMPLKNLDLGAAELMSGISVGLVRKAEVVLDHLKEIEMRCNDSLDDKVAEHFPQIHKELSSFQKSCHYYTSKLQQTMRKKFPLIREGKEDESSVEQVFEDGHESPFSHEKLSEWLDHKEREINVIRSCVEKMEGVKIVHNQSELDREVLAAGVEEALCFVFTSLKSADPCLDAMNHYLDCLKLRSTNEVPWYYSDEVLTKMKKKGKEFHNLAKALKNNPRVCFLIASIANEKYTGATIYRYKDGILVSEDFTKPNLPPVEEITDRRDLMWYACDLTLDPNTANGYLHLSEGNKKATCGELQKYPDRPERFDEYTQVLCSEGLTGRHYWEVGEMDSDDMKVAALGRPFTLGMLYDARKDELIPGVTLWDGKTLQENTSESSQNSSAFQISACDSIESKASLLDVEASLKASFLGGLIEVGGSAKYLNDTKKFKNQSRVTCQYKATTNFKQLSMINLLTMNAQQKELIEKGFATHVVTGILYGADAFFVFDSEKLEASSVQDIQGHMEAVVKKIPSFNIAGQIDIKLNDDEKKTTEKFSCKFYGDFVLESNPATFVDAVKTYVQLPKLLGEQDGNSVPVTVWLMPLKSLDLGAAELMSGISVGLVRKAEVVLDCLKEIDMRCNDSLDDKVAEHFPQIHKDLSSFQKSCHYYTSKLQQTMRKKFPLIREGKEDESSVEQVFEDGHESPFSHEKLSEWLDHKEREINVIRSCVEKMEGVKIVQSQEELDREVLAAGVEEALCFVFTSLESADPCLDAMNHYLDSLQLRSTSEVPWYYSDEVLIKMREKAEDVQNLAKALKNNPRVRFLIASIANEKYTGATIYHYKDGILVSEDFTKPNLPPVEEITDRRDLMWYACDLTLDPNTANGYLHLSEGNKKATCGEWQKYPDRPERFDEYTQVLCSEGLTGRHYWE